MLDPNTRRALVCLRYGIGDVVMELPALRALRSTLPSTRLTLLGAYPATQLPEAEGIADQVETFGRWGFRHRWDSGPAGASASFRRWLEEQRFDLIIDAHHTPPGICREIWSYGARTLESDEEAEAAAITAGRSGTSAIAQGVRVGWGLSFPSDPPTIRPSADATRFATDFLRENGVGARKPIGLSAVASLEIKRWPTERMVELIESLALDEEGPFLLFCGPQRSLGEAIVSRVRNTSLVPVGPIELDRVAALLSRCRAFVSNDTGLMHISAAVGTRTLGIFGPTRPDLYLPPGPHTAAVAPEQLSCSYRQTRSLHPPSCFANGCLHHEGPCIRQNEVGTVRRTLKALLDRPTPEPSTPVVYA